MFRKLLGGIVAVAFLRLSAQSAGAGLAVSRDISAYRFLTQTLLYGILGMGLMFLLSVLVVLHATFDVAHPLLRTLIGAVVLGMYVVAPVGWTIYLAVRGRLRFSLKTLMIGISVGAILLGTLTSAIDEMRARYVLQALGGVVVARPTTGIGRVLYGDLGSYDNFSLATSWPQVWFTRVTHVYLASTDTKDADLVHLKVLTSLEDLDLSRTEVAGPGLKYIREMTSLIRINLAYTPIADDSLAHLKAIPKLRYLNLGSTRISDAGLEQLVGLDNLRYLQLAGTPVTREGIQRLETVLPNLEITCDHAHRLPWWLSYLQGTTNSKGGPERLGPSTSSTPL